jgi:hypothetical protein
VVDAVPALASVPVGIDGDAMNLDRIFADEPGGEVTAESNAGDEELEHALNLAATGAMVPEDDADDLDGEVAE